MSDLSTIVRLVGPRVPGIFKTGVWRTLGFSSMSSKWDLRTELIITTIRDILFHSKSSISKQQQASLRDPGKKGPMWIACVAYPAPVEDDLRQLLFKSIEELNDTGNETYTNPEAPPVEAEWTGYRPVTAGEETQPSGMSEAENYEKLMSQVTSDVCVLYFHGGAYYLMDPASHRKLTAKLAHLTQGRCLSVRYRLSPQHPFPAALLDALISYLSLLYPPPGSFHKAVKPEHIVFAGDSAGGNLSLVLLQLLLHINRSSPNATVRFNGKDVGMPIPGGVATNSSWNDVTRSMPTIHSNAQFDYLPQPHKFDRAHPKDPVNAFPCAVWPSTQPRADLYCDGSMLCHPLVSPLILPSSAWKGSCPMFFMVGEEMISDDVALVAKRCHEAGVSVRWEGYEAMPHVFLALLEGHEVSKQAVERWATWISDCVTTGKPSSGAWWTLAKSPNQEEKDFQSLTKVTDEECWKLMRNMREERISTFNEWMAGDGKSQMARI